MIIYAGLKVSPYLKKEAPEANRRVISAESFGYTFQDLMLYKEINWDQAKDK